jgi:CRISPR-associated endonuclease/helicase Cas3
MDKNVFFLEAPTGSGKTNLSLAAALTLLKSSPDINKIYYVFPFTTLITQTAEAIEKTLGITREQMIQLHSRSGFNEKNEEKEDGLYKNRLNYIDNLFVNYPVTLLTHIKFFDILKGNSKETNYLIHRLANSIVIIDEVQSYPPKEWDKITYFIGKFADYFNIKFIVMSATLPKLDTLHIETINQHFTPLIKDKYRYFQNPNFKNRVNFDFTLLEEKNLDIETLADFVYEKCEKYAENNVGTVKAIIEFIFKKTASKFYNLIYEKAESAGYELYLLSGTILEPRRKEIIQLIKTSEQKEINKILLISTQVVEAGVDIDMNIGFKDKSLIDSDEQLAGRVNRNAAPNPATVYIFNLDRAFSIYGKDYRYKITRDLIDHHQYQNILAYKDFDKLYHKVIDKINKDNKNIDLVNFDDYIKYIRDLEFFNIDKDFKLINEHTESVFVPLRIPINCFSKSDLMFLKEFNCQNGGDHVNGENVWEAYEGIITSKDKNFINKRIDLKKIYGIMAQFMFSIYGKSEQLIELIRYAKDRPQNTFGIIYLLHWEDVYDYKSGIKDNKFEEAIFL